MGAYKYISKLWNKPKTSLGAIYKDKLIEWRKEGSTVRMERPTRLDRARALGYKAKPGFLVVRQRVLRGGHKRPMKNVRGRRSKRFYKKVALAKNYQQIAEERTSKKYPNCEVLNSYWVGKDKLHYWYEVVLVDRSHPSVLSDKNVSWVAQPQHRGRAFRGLTSAGRKGRGLRR